MAVSYKKVENTLPVELALRNQTCYFLEKSILSADETPIAFDEERYAGDVRASVNIPHKRIVIYKGPSHDSAIMDGRRPLLGCEAKIVNSNLEIICRSEGCFKLVCMIYDKNPGRKLASFADLITAKDLIETPYMFVLQWKADEVTKEIAGTRNILFSDLAIIRLIYQTQTTRSVEMQQYISSLLKELTASGSFQYKKPDVTTKKLKVSLKPTKSVRHFKAALPEYTPWQKSDRTWKFPMGFWNCVERTELRAKTEAELRGKIEAELRNKIEAELRNKILRRLARRHVS